MSRSSKKNFTDYNTIFKRNKEKKIDTFTIREGGFFFSSVFVTNRTNFGKDMEDLNNS